MVAKRRKRREAKTEGEGRGSTAGGRGTSSDTTQVGGRIGQFPKIGQSE